MPHRILHIIPTLDRHGAEKQMTLLTTRLPRDEFDVHVCVLTRDGPLRGELDAAGIPVTLVHKRRKIDPRAYWRLKRHIKQIAPDLVHTWLFAANAYGRAAARACGVERLVAAERCVDRWKAWYHLAIDRRLARHTQRIVTNTAAVRDFYARKGLPAEKFTVIANGVDPPAVEQPATREEILEELGLPSDARLIGVVARLWPQKQIRDLIWAVELLTHVRDDAHLLIIGDGPHRWRLTRYRDLVGIIKKVHFLGHRDDVPRLIQHFDVLALSSEYEGQSNAIMEAMAAGVPVVATDIPGNRDLLVNEQTGYLVPVGDRAEFARRINDLLNNADLAQQMGDAGRDRMRQHFTVDKMVQQYAELYRDLLVG
jgi:glycosyltransferase involved in cell wall biosynthesis